MLVGATMKKKKTYRMVKTLYDLSIIFNKNNKTRMRLFNYIRGDGRVFVVF